MEPLHDNPPRTLSRQDRITRGPEISRLFEEGLSAGDGVMRVFALPNDLGRSRVAVAVSKRHGNAVRRNRTKRLCREAFRLSRADLPDGCDYVMLPRVGPVHTLSGLQRSLRSLGSKLRRSLAP